MAKKKGRTAEEMAKTPSFMVFDMKQGFLWGPAHEKPGTKPYWNTGKQAVWFRKEVLDGNPVWADAPIVEQDDPKGEDGQ